MEGGRKVNRVSYNSNPLQKFQSLKTPHSFHAKFKYFISLLQKDLAEGSLSENTAKRLKFDEAISSSPDCKLPRISQELKYC